MVMMRKRSRRNLMSHADGDDDYNGYDVVPIDDDGDANANKTSDGR